MSLDLTFQQLTQNVIDKDVIANQNSRGLFRSLNNLRTIQGLENLDTFQIYQYGSYDCGMLEINQSRFEQF